MQSTQKPKRVWAYVNEDDGGALDKLSEVTGLEIVTILGVLVSAGVKAAVEAGYRLPLPLKLTVVEPSSARASKADRHKPLAPQ